MTTPIFPQVDPVTGALPAFTEARYVRSNTKGVASGVAALNAQGKVVDTTGVPVTDAAALAAQVAQLQAQVDKSPYILDTTPVTGATGVYPARPATPRVVQFNNPAVQPSFDGQLTGGGGMVPDHDVWWTGGTGIAAG